MEKIITVLQGRKKSAEGLTRSSKLFKSVIKAVQEKKAENIVSLDLKKIDEAVADFFILCEAQSNTQIKAIVDNVEKIVKEDCDELPYHVERGEKWTLIDYVNIVVHVFERDHRKFYNLESLWGDAGRVEHND
ncbi:MAG: ribosome silencing factor [Chitinophagaceae bacterium]|nr:ribosome silencing factor [Chitinophagaceae bacterium]